MDENSIVSLRPATSDQFVQTPYIQGLIDRAMLYLGTDYPVHLLGPTGSGKTTLALHIAQMLGRPTMLIYGDDEFNTSDLVGSDAGYQRRKTVDNYIHSVLKVEESLHQEWVDNRLTVAVREGYTLLYDEFTRSRPEANNALLSVLTEGILILPAKQGKRGYLRVHPQFRAIFTSNPTEYVGTHQTQNALMDRMITIHIPGFDLESEIMIAASRSQLPYDDAAFVVNVLNRVRARQITTTYISVRASVMLCRILAYAKVPPRPDSELFITVCIDILKLYQPEQRAAFRELLNEVSDHA